MICVCISLSGALKHWQFGRAFLAQWLKSITLQVRWAHKPGAIHPANCIGEEHGSFGRAEPKAQQPNRVISRSENGVRNVLWRFTPVSAERRCLVLRPWARQWHVCQTDTQLGKRTRLPAAYSGTATGHRLQLPRTGTGIPNLPSATISLSSKDKENIIIFSKTVAIGFSSGHYTRYYSKDRMPDRRL